MTENQIVRASVPALDEILGQSFPILDHGHIRVVDYMGDDAAIVQAARVSYGAGTKQVHEDRGLIRYLLRNAHTTPFEMCKIKLHVRVPMDCWRQWIRHRTASVNEYSTRYSEAIADQQTTLPDEWRLQAAQNKQGSDGFLAPETGSELTAAEAGFHQAARELYQSRINEGVAREQARKDLPLSTYTEAYWSTDLHNLLHFLQLRMDGHAQYEIRQYASLIGEEIVSRWVPLAWEAFKDYRLNALRLSGPEIELMRILITQDQAAARVWMLEKGWINPASGKKSREALEIESKLAALGLKTVG
ncbi:FAD-dependent thymidylate synthase [Geopsychrobacter electrodiphilus]|uniref:FAD-dependent thymidylate synthase n=1 Tax=Geopsychrobacter electrodiphilus TaxID=225196 RepID=UPI00037615EA|nr:FAD-dependent thymidylate synthase [Geopsychrobacter electrodiphilus]